MKIKETVFTWLTHRYQLIFRDEENFSEKKPITYTHGRLLAVVIPFTLLIAGGSFWLGLANANDISQVNSKDYKLRERLVYLSVTVDSLTEVVKKNEQYTSDFKKVMKADNSLLRSDTMRMSAPSIKPDSIDTDYLPQADIELREEFEGSIQFTSIASSIDGGDNPLRDIFFFPPIKGIVSEKYNSKAKHYGTDIVSKKNEPIKSVTDGTVILSSWTEDTGNVIAIQHKSNIISIYKHNSVLLKKVGDVVKAGEVVAIVGNTGKFTTGPHLHFELWYNGNPVNPERFISF
ncbi:MAG: M23 family metallopeptidase [Thermonemataceae bacterium]